MADEMKIGDGVSSEHHQAALNFDLLDQSEFDSKIFELNRRIAVLQREHQELMDEDWEIEDRIGKLTAEIGVMRIQKALLKTKIGRKEGAIKEEKTTVETIAEAVSAATPETEVPKLEDDLTSAMNIGEEANVKVMGLKKMLGEKGQNVVNLKREYESRVKELKRKVGVLEGMEIKDNSKKIRIEEEAREQMYGKEKATDELKKKAEDLESFILNKLLELEKLNKEKLSVELALGGSERKVRAMELQIIQLQSEFQEARKVIGRLKGKVVEAINGTADEIESPIDGGEHGLKGLKLHWSAIVGSIGAVVTAAMVVYVFYGKRR